MIPWWWILVSGFVCFFLGIFAICIFITGGQESEPPEKKCEGDEGCDLCGGWY